MSPIRFYFDFVSTFSYIVVQKIDDLAARHGRTVDWRAMSLGHLFHAQGVKAPPEIPAKFAYYNVDFPRSCAKAGLACKMPAVFPPDVKLARLMFWRMKKKDEAASHAFARAISAAVYGRGEAVATADDILRACKGVAGVTADEIAAAANDAAAKNDVIKAGQDAIADGVFGAPHMILDGEPFWGADRLDVLAWRLEGSSSRA